MGPQTTTSRDMAATEHTVRTTEYTERGEPAWAWFGSL